MTRLYLAAGAAAVLAASHVGAYWLGASNARQEAAERAAEAYEATIKEIEDAGIDPSDLGGQLERLCDLAPQHPRCL